MRNKRSWFLLAYIVLVTAVIFSVRWDAANDDPFITYRYARNLAGGQGFVYNPGERVLSTTTPLLTAILALGLLAKTDLPGLAALLGALSLAVGAVFIWDLAQSARTPWVGWAALLLYPATPLLVNTVGSETPLYLALCLGAFSYYCRQKYALSALMAGLAVLARPDGALVALLLGLDFVIRVRRPLPWKAVLIFAGITLPWFIFAWLYFGSPLPVTLAAKQAQGGMAISRPFATGVFVVLKPYAQQWVYQFQAVLALVGIGYLAWAVYSPTGRRTRVASVWLLPLIWVLVYYLAYTLLGVSGYFWYYAPLAPAFVILVGLGLQALADFIYARRSHSNEKTASTGTAMLAWSLLILILLLAFQARFLWPGSERKDPRAGLYKEIGLWLKENTAAHDRIGLIEVGIIGYYAERPVIDFAGLLQPDVADQLKYQSTYLDSAQWALEHYQPEFVVIPEGFLPSTGTGFFASHCLPVYRFVGQAYSYPTDFVVYACQFPGELISIVSLDEHVTISKLASARIAWVTHS